MALAKAVETAEVGCWVLICSMYCRLARDAAGADVHAHIEWVLLGDFGPAELRRSADWL